MIKLLAVLAPHLLGDATVVDQLKPLVPYLGVPGVIFLCILFALHKKWICLGRELDYERELRAQDIKEKNEWKEEARQNNQQVERATRIAHHATNVAEKVINGKDK